MKDAPSTPQPANLIPFPTESLNSTGSSSMKTTSFNPVPSIDQFQRHAIDQICLGEEQSQVSFSIELEHDHITQRLMFGLLDESRENGACVAIYPATGEVCDLTNGGSVIGYLSLSPMMPGQSIHCELLIYKYGRNCVCTVRICGETFLYPAFVIEGAPRLTALVGYDSGAGVQWDDEVLRVETSQAVA